MKVLVDMGNSRLKWATAVDGEYRYGATLELTDRLPVPVDSWRALGRPESVWISHVGAEAVREPLEHWLWQQWQIRPRWLQSQAQQLGVRNCYPEAQQLGVDRWMALLAARAMTANHVVVVDCGTAITIDALEDNGDFRGGVIMPGVRLALGSLMGTGRIGHRHRPTDSLYCNNTAEAIWSGVMAALSGGISRVLQQYADDFNRPPDYLITGGDGKRFLERLDVHFALVEDLVLRGVHEVARSE